MDNISNDLVDMRGIGLPSLKDILISIEDKNELTDKDLDILSFFSQNKEHEYRKHTLLSASRIIGSKEGRQKKRLVNIMLSGLRDDFAAYFALNGLTGHLDKSFIPLLGGILINYRTPLLRIQAIEALQAIGNDAVIPYLEYGLNDRHYLARDYSATALASLNFVSSVPMLADRLRRERNIETKVGCWSALFRLTGDTKWNDKLVKALSYPDSVVVDHAASSMGITIEEDMLEIDDVLTHLKYAHKNQQNSKAKAKLKEHIKEFEIKFKQA